MNTYDIDAHKLHYHPQRIAQWLSGESIYPIYMELSPSGACNHRCIFCTMDFMGYKPQFLNTKITCERLQECGKLGVKSLMFAGEGEPLLHKDIGLMAETAKKSGIDVSFTTNAVLLKPELAKRLLPITSWIKVSCNAGTPDSYAATHQCPAEDFEKVLRNMEEAVLIREQENSHCTLGFQCILLPENAAHMPALARRVRELGADYLVIKPYTRHPQSLVGKFDDIHYGEHEELAKRLQAEERADFKVIFRHEAMSRWDMKTTKFERCLALPFWAYVTADARVYGCSRHLNQDDFYYGNLEEQTFEDLWKSRKRIEKLAHCEDHLDISNCHVTCRMELINTYLWRLKHPESHDNFI
jgi:MoaA/NifB/PqqE/SkfB family radical SAM enzyme